MAMITQEKKREIHSRIFEVSRKLFAENGFEETSMRVIAKEAGIEVSRWLTKTKIVGVPTIQITISRK